MTPSTGLGESTVYQWLFPQLSTFPTDTLTHNGTTYTVRSLPTILAASHLYGIFDHEGVEVFRFTLKIDVSRRLSPSLEVEPTALNLESSPVAPLTPEWIEGQWGPAKLADGLSYRLTPVTGDAVWSEADQTEWTVITYLTHANPHRVTIANDKGEKFSFNTKWSSPVKFRRSKMGESKKLLEKELGAQEIDDSHLKQDNWILGGKKW